MVRVVVMEQVGLGEWNEKSRKENGQDAADGMKQEVFSIDRVMHIGNVTAIKLEFLMLSSHYLVIIFYIMLSCIFKLSFMSSLLYCFLTIFLQ